MIGEKWVVHLYYITTYKKQQYKLVKTAQYYIRQLTFCCVVLGTLPIKVQTNKTTTTKISVLCNLPFAAKCL